MKLACKIWYENGIHLKKGIKNRFWDKVPITNRNFMRSLV